jgi:lysophospholipase L1-like esterase
MLKGMGKYNIICAIQNEKGRENMRILCIGDSNTWGYNPENGSRFEKRWTKVLASYMPEHEIIEEGLNGRTLLSQDIYVKERCGIDGLKMLLLSHRPIDCVIIMLGTNELKNCFKCSADYIANGVEEF